MAAFSVAKGCPVYSVNLGIQRTLCAFTPSPSQSGPLDENYPAPTLERILLVSLNTDVSEGKQWLMVRHVDVRVCLE